MAKILNVIAVTGGRDYKDRQKVYEVLDRLHAEQPIDLLVHGGCKSGADDWADRWADLRDVFKAVFPVSGDIWNAMGPKAGPMRNRLMIEVATPSLLVAFPGGRGTMNCVGCQRKRGGQVLHIS
jgi:hypothetical protein